MKAKNSRQILSIVVVFFWASEYCHVPYFTPYLNMLGFTATAIGVMVGAYGLTQTIVRIPLGIYTDVSGAYKGMVLMGSIFTTVSSFGLIFAKSMWFVIFCRVLAGIAASTWIAFTVLYAAYYKEEEGVQAMANINAFNNGGKLLAFALGTITASIWDYRIPLVMSFLTGLVAIIFALRLKPIEIKREPMQISHIARVFKNPCVLIPSFFAILMQMILHGTVFSFTSTVAEELGASSLQIGINTSLFTIIQVIAASWIGKKLVPKIGTTMAVAGGFMLMAASCILVAVTPWVWLLYVAQILCGFGNSMIFSVVSALAIRYVPAENKSTAMGLFQALYGIGMTAGPLMVGHVAASGGYSAAYMMFAAIAAVAMILSALLLPRVHKMGEKKAS